MLQDIPLTLHLVGNIPGILKHIQQRFGSEPVFREFSRDFLVFLADPREGPLFTQAALRGRGLDFDTAYAAAMEHTKYLFQSGSISIIHDGLLSRVDCDGFWPSHLPLMDWFWENNALLETEGELVLGIPTRTELFFSDTAKVPLLPMLMQEVSQRYEQGPHRLSSRLFVRRNGAFEPYVFGGGSDSSSKKWWAFWQK